MQLVGRVRMKRALHSSAFVYLIHVNRELFRGFCVDWDRVAIGFKFKWAIDCGGELAMSGCEKCGLCDTSATQLRRIG